MIRFHLTSPADSFKLIQPSAELIQVAIYKNGVIANLVSTPALKAPFTRIAMNDVPNGVGVDIHLQPNHYFIARAYPDANRRHLLVGLTKATSREISILTAGMTPIDWIAATTPVRIEIEDVMVADSTEGMIDTIPAAPVIIPRPVNGYDGKIHTIVIDPGHGGHDPGALGTRGTREKDVVLKVSLLLGEMIKQRMPDVNLVYTRSDDRFINLYERGRIANRAKGDLFISIHSNAHRTQQPNGAEVYFLGLARSEDALEVMMKENSVIALEDPATRTRELTDEEIILYELTNTAYISNSQYFAALIDGQFKSNAKRRSRGVKQAPFIVLYHASMPSVLVELGFLSNPTEELYLRSVNGQKALAESIFLGLQNYRNQMER